MAETQSKKKEREDRRSNVRVFVTYGAAIFLFLGGGCLVTILALEGMHDKAISLFMTIVPVSSGVIAFWFAGRRSEKAQEEGDPQAQKKSDPAVVDDK